MKSKSLIFALLLIGIVFTCIQCSVESETEGLKYKYEYIKPNLPTQVLNYRNVSFKQDDPFFHNNGRQVFEENVTDHGATLGRVLFYDKNLSKNNKVSCGSCHHQENAFADNVAGSVGFDGAVTPRNSKQISNVVFNQSLFWDGRERDLRTMVLQPVKNHIEMGLDNMAVLERKIESVDFYKELFKNAYGDEKVTKERIADAMTQFVMSITSFGAEFDQLRSFGGWADDSSVPPSFTDQQKRGLQLFQGKGGCAGCHAIDNLSERYEDIGLDGVYKDKGRGDVETGNDGRFNVPALRNIALTAPYMHDGRFKTLDEVINHYSEGIQASPNLSWSLTDSDFNGNTMPRKMNFTQSEKEDLKAFLQTFTDNTILTSEKYSNPFK